MAYSLHHNQQFIYYDGRSCETVKALLRRDQHQLALSDREMLQQAECYKASDRAFIKETLDRNFESREDAVSTIKVFVEVEACSQFLCDIFVSLIQIVLSAYVIGSHSPTGRCRPAESGSF